MSGLKAAVAGAGFIGPVHVEALRRLGVEVVGITGISPEESKEAAAALNLRKAYSSFEEMISDPEVDVVHIATPNKLHKDMALAALEAGKHVVCEKPLAMNSSESRQLADAIKETNLVGAVNYNLRFYPLCLQAKSMVEKGNDVGRIYAVCGSYVQDWLLYPTDYNWRVLAEEGGPLRAVADIGTHWLDMVQFITGLRVTRVCAHLSTVHPVRYRPTGEVETFEGKKKQATETEPVEIDTEDMATILLEFDNGATGTLWVSQVTAGRKNCLRYEIAGEKAALAWNSERPNELWIGHRDGPNETLLKDPALLEGPAADASGYPGGHNEGYPDTFKQCFGRVYEYIASDRRETPQFPTFEDGHEEILLCEAILRSHKKQGWEDVTR